MVNYEKKTTNKVSAGITCREETESTEGKTITVCLIIFANPKSQYLSFLSLSIHGIRLYQH